MRAGADARGVVVHLLVGPGAGESRVAQEAWARELRASLLLLVHPGLRPPHLGEVLRERQSRLGQSLQLLLLWKLRHWLQRWLSTASSCLDEPRRHRDRGDARDITSSSPGARRCHIGANAERERENAVEGPSQCGYGGPR